jgi:hypothetical protein
MKLASVVFLLLLLHAHGEGDRDDQLARPLSLFRDGSHGWLGYALFAVLLVIGWLYARALARSRKEVEAGLAGCAFVLLLAVAVTASWGALHLVCSLVLLALLYGYCAVVLHHARSPWLVGHLGVPVVLAVAIGFHSYGAWQKGFIVYSVLAVTIHHHLLRRPAGTGPSLGSPSPWRCGRPVARRKVHEVQPGRAWVRGKPARGYRHPGGGNARQRASP